LTTFQVKRTYQSKISISELGKKARETYGDDVKAIDITFIVLDPLFSPTPHLPELVPSETIWEAVCHGDVDTIRLWSDSNPSVNLEAIHVQYECCLLYSAA